MIIQKLDGTRFDVADYGLKRLFHRIPSADISHSFSTVDGRSDILTETKINNRTIEVEFLYMSYDIYDYYLLRDELNALFMRAEPFYIIFKREPYKRWLVKTAGQFEIPPHPNMQSFTVEFITLNEYAESVATTTTLKEWDVNKWGWNGSIDWEMDLRYSHSGNSFIIYNLGNETIDPRKHQLIITVKATSEYGVEIRNTTNNERYRYTGNLNETDNLILDGIRSTKNGLSVFRETNHGLITLTPGPNQFLVSAQTLHDITFDFRFLYK